MNTVDGRKISQNLMDNLKVRLSNLGFVPTLCDVVVGSDPVSLAYINIKGKRAHELGIDFQTIQLDENTSTEQLVSQITLLSAGQNMCGLLIQLPLPPQINRQEALRAIDPTLDVDNLNHGPFLSPTVGAVLEIFRTYAVDLKNKQVLIVGQGELVGKPLKRELEKYAKQVRTIDEATSSSLEILGPKSDILISAVGSPKMITDKYVKEGSIIIDCGTSESAGSIVGDVDSDSVADKAALLAAVPGGVGPITVIKLLENTILSAEYKK